MYQNAFTNNSESVGWREWCTFFHDQSPQSYVVAFGWEGGSKSQSMNLQSGALATALKARLDTFGPRNYQQTIVRNVYFVWCLWPHRTLTLFYIIFVHCFWNFAVKIVKYWRRKVISRSVQLLRSIAFSMTWRQSNVMSVNQPFHLRNKFHFSEVHGSMKATGHVQSKWRPRHVQSKWRP